MKVSGRSEFSSPAAAGEHEVQQHVVTAPHDLRRNCSLTRSTDKGETFSFELIAPMFDFMEREF